MNKRLGLVITLIELIKIAFETGNPIRLKKILTDKIVDAESARLRAKANEIITFHLECAIITDEFTAKNAIEDYSMLTDKNYLYWILAALLYESA